MTEKIEGPGSAIGKITTSEDVITASQAGRLAGALGVDNPAIKKGDVLPNGWHAVFFPGLAPLSGLAEDGQPASNSRLPRRRIIGVRTEFHEPLLIGDDIVRETEVIDVVSHDYGAGPTILFKVRDRISSARGLAVIEERDFLSFEDGGPGELWPAPEMPADAAWRKSYDPTPVMMFRLSAVRYNSHRVHYDRDYAMKVEGYGGLLVPVTLVSFHMMELCREHAGGKTLKSFSYRSEQPIVDTGPYAVHGKLDGGHATLWATGPDGDLAVTGDATVG
jgi:3-methylfumaryl-CoA hydratase